MRALPIPPTPTMTDTSKIEFHLHSIQLEQFDAFENQYDPKKDTSFGVELEVLVSGKERLVSIGLWANFHQGRKTILKIGTRCHYQVLPASWESFLLPDHNQLKIPKGFCAHLALHSAGTLRGILFAKTEHTPFAKLIFPVIEIEELFTEDILTSL